jgi:hypothetical protein
MHSLEVDCLFPIQESKRAMRKLIALVLPVALAAPWVCANAGVAPAAPNSALTQSGAKIAAPARQSAQDNDENKKGHQESSPKDPAR